jgi:hypothetical protein
MPGLLLGAALGGELVASLVLRVPRWRWLAVGGAWVALMGVVVPRNFATGRVFKQSVESIYWPMGTWVRDRAIAGDAVFIGDIGYVGYISNLQLFDGAGLVSPRVLQFYKSHLGDPGNDVAFVLQEQPRFVILQTRSPLHAHWQTEDFLARYRPRVRFPSSEGTVDTPLQNPGELRPGYTVYERVAL